MKRQNVSDAVIKRLPRYYRYLDDLHLKGIVRISSSTLGEKMGITASQIRQDLSCAMATMWRSSGRRSAVSWV